MLRIREKQLQIHNRKCSCLKNYKYIRYIISIIHIKYINSFFFLLYKFASRLAIWYNYYRTISYKSLLYFFLFSLVLVLWWRIFTS